MTSPDGPLRVGFINPFGTAIFDDIIDETVRPYASPGTELTVLHLDGVPRNIDFYYPRHIIEMRIAEVVRDLESQGYDAAVIGCCSDPGLRVARELVDIPVIGPLEASVNSASYFGHAFSVVTDSPKAVSRVRDLIRSYGGGNCRGVHCVDRWVSDMLDDTRAVAEDAIRACSEAIRHDGSEVVILGCTIIGACLQRETARGAVRSDVPILDPNLLALKAAEMLGSLHRQGGYRLSRVGMYARHEQHDPAEAEEVRTRFRLVDDQQPANP